MKGFVLSCLLLACAAGIGASDHPLPPAGYPKKPLTAIVPFARGGGLDVSMRLLGRYAEPELGQKIDVVNTTAKGNIQGNYQGIQAAPDGYTLGVWGMGLVTDELIIRNVPYTHHDVQPVCMFADDAHVIGVSRGFAEDKDIRTFDDLLAYVGENPGRVTFGVGGNWTSHDFIRLRIEELTGVKFVRMPFLGGALAAEAAAKGNCDVVSPFLPEFMPWLESGAIIPLAVSDAVRMSQLPDIPTTVELGHPEMLQTMWRVVTVPKGTPKNIVAHLESVFRKAVENPNFIKEAKALGVNPMFMGTAVLEDFIEEEYEHFLKKTEELGIRVLK